MIAEDERFLPKHQVWPGEQRFNGERLAAVRGDSGRMVRTPAYAWVEGFDNQSGRDIKEENSYLDSYDRTVTLLREDDD